MVNNFGLFLDDMNKVYRYNYFFIFGKLIYFIMVLVMNYL